MTTETSRRRAMLAGGAALTAALGGCGGGLGPAATHATTPTHKPTPASPTATPIGDGSTSDTGPQPNQPVLPDLVPGVAPPQFVVISWDGGGETDAALLTRFRAVAREIGASMTIFLSGLYTLRGVDAKDYRPPRNGVGRSDIPFLSDASVRRTIEGIGQAWLEGNEIGTHFNGHFCGGSGSVANWSPDDWRSEIDQAVWMVTHWRSTTGWADVPSLPFDYRTELIGGRTPCLLGQQGLIPTAATLGWRYDSSTGGRQVWPRLFDGTQVWNIPMSIVPFPGHTFEVIAMDYNYMANQSGPQPAKDPRHWVKWGKEARAALLAGHERALTGNRAPLIIGNHFEQWNGGVYMDAVEQAMRTMAAAPDTHLVSFKQLVRWLDRQDPILLKSLQALDVGAAPAGGWSAFGVGD
ncbi:MAG TPA: hypothetical protein PKH97_15335 [Tetrasphaera sp.]|uniref:hypothetical protein n=1 Tax=Nostocoides sp. TaxID=1917966 RepID=UPI002C122EC9|nr:hypothetical protein [Tetrasphaera sp.]HNQ08546.1 hypothetical protein [Tetrasphaera sp.]